MIPTLPGLQQAFVQIGGERIDPAQVIYLEGSGSYTFVYFEKKPRMVLTITLSKVTNRVPGMLRVHKSFSVSVDKINHAKRTRKEISGKDTLVITLQGGTQIAVSRRRSSQVSDVLMLQK